MMTRTNSEYYLAVASILFSASMWGLIWYPMRLLDEAGMSTLWTTLLIYLVAACVSMPIFFRKSWRGFAFPLELWWLALAAGVTNVAFMVALIEGEVLRVMLLFYLSPLWTVIIGHWWLGEVISRKAMALIVVAMSGTLMMLWQPEMGLPWPHGLADWLSIFGGITFSLNNVLSRKLAYLPMELKTTMVYWGVVLVSGIVLLLQQAQLPQVSIDIWLMVLIVGGACISAMTLAVLYGLARMPVYRSAIIMLFELIVGAISAWWLTNETMSTAEWWGGALIFIAAYGIARLEKH